MSSNRFDLDNEMLALKRIYGECREIVEEWRSHNWRKDSPDFIESKTVAAKLTELSQRAKAIADQFQKEVSNG